MRLESESRILALGLCLAAPLLLAASHVGVIERVSVAADGSQSNGDSGGRNPVAISGDGRFVAFESSATNLVPNDTNGAVDVFLRDTCFGAEPGCTPTTVRVSVAADGSQSNGDSLNPAISANGRFVAFQSFANLGPDDPNVFFWHLFVRDTCLGAEPGCTPTTVRASVAADGSQSSGGNRDPAINADGRFVAFWSVDSNLVPNDTNSVADVFVRDTCLGAPPDCTPTTVRVSVAADGSQANDAAFEPAISADGRFVAFWSFATNLVPDDTNGTQDVFVRDTCLGAEPGCTPTTVRASVAADGSQATLSGSRDKAISADGRFVAFGSFASNLVPDDTNGSDDIFVRDTCQGAPPDCTPTTVRVSVAADGSQSNRGSRDEAISADGRFVAFASRASNLVPDDTNGVFDVFLARTGFSSPAINPGGTVNGASFSNQPPAASSIGSVFGTNLASSTAFADMVPLPTTLGGASLQLNGIDAPLFFASPLQINFQFPNELQGLSQASISVTVGGVTGNAEIVPLAPFGPGLFATNQAGSGQGAILISGTGGAVAAPTGTFPGSRPVMAGEFIEIFCTGLGAVTNQPATGAAASTSPLSETTTTPTLTIGGVAATVSFSGLAPGFVGLYQVNAQVPATAPTGDAVDVVLTISGVTANIVTIAVQ